MAPGDDRWQPTGGKGPVILSFGAFLGELVRRQFGGEWREDPLQPENVLAAHVVVGGGHRFFEIAKVYRRLGDGAQDRLEPSYLRWEPTKKMVQFAQDLYNQTRRIKEGQNHFTEVLRGAERLLGYPVPIPASVLGLPATKGKSGKGGAAKPAAKSEGAKHELMKAALAKGKRPSPNPSSWTR